MFITGSPWKDRYLRVFYAPDGDNGTGASGSPADGTDAGVNAQPGEVPGAQGGADANDENEGDIAAQLAKLKADMAKQKAALDKATSEANGYKKQLRAKQTAEEIAAEEAKAAEEARNNELNELRRKFAVMEITKDVAVKLGCGEESSGKIAEFINGAEDPNAVITEFQKILAAQEKKLRLEFGKVPPPGAGYPGGEDAELQKAIKLAQEIGRERSISGKSIKDSLGGYVR